MSVKFSQTNFHTNISEEQKYFLYFVPQQVPFCSSARSLLFQLAVGHSAHGVYKAMPTSENEKEKGKGKCKNILPLFQFHLPLRSDH